MEKRLLILSSEFPPGPGGIGTHAFFMAEHLSQNGMQVLVITPQDYVDAEKLQIFNKKQNFQIVTLRNVIGITLKAYSHIKIINRWIQEWSPNVLLATGARSAWILSILSKKFKLPWIAIGHGTEFGGNKWNWRSLLTRWAFNHADGVICVSNYTKGVMNTHGITPKKTTVIPNGANSAFFAKKAQADRSLFFRETECQEKILSLLTVGNVTDRKGQEVVIRAMPEVLARNPNVHYFMVGMPTIRVKLDKIARDLGIEDHIHFLGQLENEQLLRAYQDCDIFIMTSRKLANGDVEGFGIAVIEAALCGKPAIVSNGSGLTEAVINGRTGICVHENNPQETAEAILQLTTNTELLLKLGENAYTRAQKELTWHAIGMKYLEFINEFSRNPK